MVKSRNLVEIKNHDGCITPMAQKFGLKRFAQKSVHYIVMILESDHWNVPALPHQRSKEISHSIVLKNQLRPFFYLLFQRNEIFPVLFVFFVCVSVKTGYFRK